MNTLQSLKKNKIPSPAICISKNARNYFLLIIFASIAFQQTRAQADSRLLLADKYFSSGDYFTAAGLYEQFLHPPVKQKQPTGFPLNSKKNRTDVIGNNMNKYDILYKQAESYRLANYWEEAAERYKECLESDPAKYASALYWYSVCQRSLGKYKEAEANASQFLSTTAGSANPYQQSAENELETIQYIKNQLNRPDSILFTISKINSLNGQEKGIYAPAATQGNQLMITSTKIDSIVTPGVNPYHNRLFYSTLVNGNLQNILPVTIDGMDASLNQGTASLSANGDHLYFTQWKKENAQTISSIYYSTKTDSGWGIPVLLPLVNSEVSSSKQPFCSIEGKYLFFASDRPGGSGNFDIWISVLLPDGSAGEPVNAGEMLNTAANEQAPFYHSSSHSLVFASDRKPGMGGFDLFTAKGWDMNWEKPENIGYPVNSSRDDLYFYAPEKSSLLSKAIISSDRGSECCLETYTVSKTPKKNIIKGFVQDCKNNEPIADVEIIMKSVSGKVVSTKTAVDGSYQFEIAGYADEQQLILGKELYKEKISGINITEIDDTGWLTDIFSNEPICIEKKLVIKPENVVTLYFDFDKSNLKERGIAQLDSIYSVLTEDSIATIQISGYTDGRGTEEYNKVLSDKRARSCAGYLIEKGIDPNRISFESFGACCPIEMEMINGRDNADGRSRNRRALINIKKD